MKLYHAITTYHLLVFIVERMAHQCEGDATLLIAEVIAEKHANYNILIELEIFQEILVVPYRKLSRIQDPQTVITECDKVFSQLLPHELTEYSEFHIAGAQYYFSLFLMKNNIQYYFYEEGSGILGTPDTLKTIVEGLNKMQYHLAEDNGLFTGNNPSVIKKVCNFNAQPENFFDELAEHFDVVGTYLSLPIEEQKLIKDFFVSIKEISVPENSCILLTQHFANLKILTFDEQILIYQIVLDYFLKNYAVVFKPHPDDLMYYSQLFPDYQIIREKFPSEFLPVMFDNKPNLIATISSTAIKNLYPYFNNNMSFDITYEKDFPFTHKYYIALKIIELLGIQNTALNCIGTNLCLINNLMEYSDISLINILPQNSTAATESVELLYMIDCIGKTGDVSEKNIIELLEQVDEKALVFLMNSQKDFCFYDIAHKELWNNISLVCIEKNILRNEEFYSDTETEVIYIYSKNKELLSMIDTIDINKNLPHTGMTISKEKLTDDQKRIKVLEGILEATEKRLLHYIKLVEEQK